MRRSAISRIREKLRRRHYDLTNHAIEEMAADGLDVVDIEVSIRSGSVTRTETDDPRGTRYVVSGTGADGNSEVSVVVRFTSTGRLLIITAYLVTDRD